jgi:hypothetical protein
VTTGYCDGIGRNCWRGGNPVQRFLDLVKRVSGWVERWSTVLIVAATIVVALATAISTALMAVQLAR